MIDPSYSPGTKLMEASKNIATIYFETNSYKGTQLIFSDMGTPKSNNKIDNLFEHLSGDMPQADLLEIFGEDYYEKKSRPKLEDIEATIREVLKLTDIEVGDLVEEAKEKQDVMEYSKGLNSMFPYKEELNSKKERLLEIDSIIIAKAKEVDESKKVMTSLQNEGDETKQACCLKRNF